MLHRILLACRRGMAAFRVRSLEIRIDDLHEARFAVRDTDTQLAIAAAIRCARSDLARARGDYNALYPPGKRKTWEHA